ncbi:TonB-dependent receptor [Sphingomonas sp.]|uniref:TonB-dependent receptor domain-containing protein n=1 Tax=Sphingomonas sp. TaxID=28214 RepID=UPI001B0524F1|nr:TonB-dependent receptor [Sphingomonas sp.]MBO9712872.1 TonB-dependent receptor [Sphingomonas sp.]
MANVFRQKLLASTLLAGSMLVATAAAAQDAPADNNQSVELPSTDSTEADDAPIIVTGSRIHRDNFTTPSPVNVYTRDDRVLAGSRTTAEILQSPAVTSGTSQINGSFLGYVSEGGAAASTVGLRGLSSSRTLVLLNGRRLAPAGVGPQLVSADLNTLPTAMVQRIEVLREGASSVYGSDAIAGVVNVITDDKVNGLTFDAFTDQPIEHGGGGRSYRLSATGGKVFDRGHITASFEYRQQTGLRVGDRKEFSCPRDLYFDPTTGAEVGQHDPVTGQLMCFPYTTNGGSGIASGYGIAQSFYPQPASRITYNNGDINQIKAVNGLDRTSASPTQLQDHLLSPVKTYTGYVNGAYELGMLGDAEIYGEGLFTRRESHQDGTYQLNLSGGGLSPNNEIYGGDYYGTPLSVYGFPTSPFYPNAVAAAGYQVFTPFVVPDRTTRSSQRIDFVRANGGLRGSLGLGDWHYDANFQYSLTKSRYELELIDVSRLNNALQTIEAPAGTPDNLVTVALPGQAGAGGRYTCASNYSGGTLVSGASCVPLNLYDPAIMLGGHIPSNVFDYLFVDNVGHTTFRQQTFSLNLDGTLFNLPAGPVRAAVGFEHRYDFINDVPSEAAQNGTLYNYSSAGITTGSDIVNEVYGELNIPIVKEKPFFYDLELDGSVRYTHYRSYGSDTTYHLNAQWAPAEFIRFRGNYGTSFRAPNLYEQYVADQTGFYGSAVDPCANVGTLDHSSTVYKNCITELTPILGTDNPLTPQIEGAQGFIATAGPQVTTRGGAGNLKAEHSTSWGVGGVLTLPKTIADFSFAVDYYHIKVKDEVSVLGNLILDRCYEADDFGPNNPYCALIAPRLPASDPQKGNLSSFLNPYLNVAQQGVSGIDFDLRYSTPLFGGKFRLAAQATRMLHQTFQLFATDPVNDYNGTLGVQGAGSGPKWVGDVDLRYTLPSNNVTVRWGIKYVGPQNSGDGETVAAPLVGNVLTDLHAEPYWEHGVSIQFRWADVGQITMGANNLFNALPPTLSSYPTSGGQFTRVGNYYNSSNYDLLGRTLFINVTRSF